ncbi:MAG: alanine--tRNA ligase [Candidatus Moranbacteria bacterium]|nr:alanine--tRNA ligase [Candidatus Moranbacteria bacterium]
MKTNLIRKAYLDFFRSKNHAIIPSASLLPENDPTTLFTGSGMQPMVPYLLGEKHPLGKRIADSQKSFRAQDIEDVGDNRHTTFFEMLGNWSLGDYFKKEQISWIFEFLTQVLKLDPRRLYVSVYQGNSKINIDPDQEAVKIWQQQFKKVNIQAQTVKNASKKGMGKGRIFFYDENENWWSRAGVPDNMPIGEPGGPDSEIFWDFKASRQIHEDSIYKDQPCHPACDCGRFLEIGNNVFMQYLKTKNGFKPLENKNIDFGGGLERLAAAIQDDPDMFNIDLFKPLKKELEKLSQKQYQLNQKTTRAFRIIMDHIRAAVFLISDGAGPSNKDQGYFTRRLIRRGIRSAHQLNIQDNFTQNLARSIIKIYEKPYPGLKNNQNLILDALKKEETGFKKTLNQGLKKFEQLRKKQKHIDGQQAFDLYQSYGFPIEMTQELAQEHGIKVDLQAFKQAQKNHQKISRQGAQKKFKGGLADQQKSTIQLHTAAHLLLAALKKILGHHVKQKGANITAERLRFDFSHPAKLTEQEIKETQQYVNEIIEKNLPVKMREISIEQAREQNITGEFNDRYQNLVKIYTIGSYSQEICGGPHVKNTNELGKFQIIKQQSAGAGVRRIKAILE